jgi:hypothetical protein
VRRRRLALPLALAKSGALGGLAAVLLVGAVQTPSSPWSDDATLDRATPVVRTQDDDALARSVQQRCSSAVGSDASGTGRPPAVVRTESGRLRVVDFETGWAVYAGRRPGHLVAVCGEPSGPYGTTRVGHEGDHEVAERLRD